MSLRVKINILITLLMLVFIGSTTAIQLRDAKQQIQCTFTNQYRYLDMLIINAHDNFLAQDHHHDAVRIDQTLFLELAVCFTIQCQCQVIIENLVCLLLDGSLYSQRIQFNSMLIVTSKTLDCFLL